MNDIILRETIVDGSRVTFRFEVRGTLRPYFNTDSMFIKYDRSITDVPISILNIAFVSSLLPLMWLTDTTMWVYEIDRTFYDAIIRIKAAYQDLYPHYPLKGKFIAAKTQNNSYIPERESLLLFSGGLDAHVSYLRIREQRPILCNIQGWYQDNGGDDKAKAAEADRRDISAFAKRENLQFEFVKSNFAVLVSVSEFHKNIEKKLGHNWWHGFQHSMSFISIAMPIAYLEKIRNIYIASSFGIGDVGECASYATTDIEFKFAENGGCFHDAFEMTRQDKVKFLVDYQKASGKPYPIRVCSFNDKNCCECEKCFRTILQIVSEAGDIADFGFEINGNLKKHWEKVMNRKIYCWGVEAEGRIYKADLVRRINDNYEKIKDKEFVDWYLNYDFKGEKEKAKRIYYRKNFFSILKRKIRER